MGRVICAFAFVGVEGKVVGVGAEPGGGSVPNMRP